MYSRQTPGWPPTVQETERCPLPGTPVHESELNQFFSTLHPHWTPASNRYPDFHSNYIF